MVPSLHAAATSCKKRGRHSRLWGAGTRDAPWEMRRPQSQAISTRNGLSTPLDPTTTTSTTRRKLTRSSTRPTGRPCVRPVHIRWRRSAFRSSPPGSSAAHASSSRCCASASSPSPPTSTPSSRKPSSSPSHSASRTRCSRQPRFCAPSPRTGSIGLARSRRLRVRSSSSCTKLRWRSYRPPRRRHKNQHRHRAKRWLPHSSRNHVQLCDDRVQMPRVPLS
mmetsp:Transcript_4728/g.10310  ORF Transcript_4728/g.10310 Transcript_4728/m.10310 type:complete len:221 (+) Transcript_4728:341-1003(+)